MPPNLFSFATSELSQDAALCWLLAWADPAAEAKNQVMHQAGTNFLLSLFEHANTKPPASITSIAIRKQAGGVIDVLCVINGNTAILIEDKRGTTEHSGQLARYKKIVEQEGFSPEKIIPLYIQTGDQDNYATVTDHGYTVVERRDLLEILEDPIVNNAAQNNSILADFTAHLRSIENDVESFRHVPVENWSWNAWIGFYKHLQTTLGGGWSYVPNRSGGFLGFWWHFLGDDSCEQYLQLEMNKLCFKISVADRERRGALRNHWSHKILMETARRAISASRPRRFGSGAAMTVAVLDQDYRASNEDGTIDLERTIQILESAQVALEAACSLTATA